MALRFRRSVKLIPGVRVNFGKKGVSLSAGVRGASITVGKNGAYGNLGIPGSGVSVRQKLSGGSATKSSRPQVMATQEAIELNIKLKENGELEFIDANGLPLSRLLVNLVWAQNEFEVSKWLESQLESINRESESLSKVYLDTPNPLEPFQYTPREFDKLKPEFSEEVFNQTKPVKTDLKPLGFFSRLFLKSRVAEHHSRQAEIEQDFIARVREWEDEKTLAKQKYESQLNEWTLNKQRFEQAEADLLSNFPSLIRESVPFMERMLEEYFDTISWPKETLISYQVDGDGFQVLIDVDFPEIEDFPHRSASFSANRKRLLIKEKSAKDKNILYATHIHGVLFRIIGGVFAMLPRCTEVVISGYSQRLNPATGHIEDQYLLSAREVRANFELINFMNLEDLNPIDYIASIDHKRSMSKTGVFKSIAPLI